MIQTEFLQDIPTIELPEKSDGPKPAVTPDDIVEGVLDYTQQSLESSTGALLNKPPSRRKSAKPKALKPTRVDMSLN